MYRTVMLDGEEIVIKMDLDERETGIVIPEVLEDTDDLSEVVNYIEDNIINEDFKNE